MLKSEESSAAAVPSRGISKAFTFWQDREIRFDSEGSVFAMRPNAEEVLATFHHVEDTKGNGGQVGTLLVTNLRFVWWSARRRSTNLSIGYHSVQSITVQEASSRLLGGKSEALFLSCKFGPSRFLFVFTYVPKPQDSVHGVPGAPTQDGQAGLFAAAMASWRAYQSTCVYRELRLRGSVIVDNNLIVLDGESVLSKLSNVTNVSKDAHHEGTFITTNLRIVWFAASSDNLNVSVPYMQFTALHCKSSRFGPALVVETSSYAGGFTLGFRIEPVSRLTMLYQEVASMWKVWTAKPILGMKVFCRGGDVGDSSPSEAFAAAEHGEKDGEEGNDSQADAARHQEMAVIEQAPGDAFAAYYADEGQKGIDRKPVFDPSIGLAVEKLRKGVTLRDLWSVTVK